MIEEQTAEIATEQPTALTSENSNLHIWFSFDHLDILSMVENQVYLRCDSVNMAEENETLDSEECILIVDRDDFHAMLDRWLEVKQAYFERCDIFCGVGTINITNYLELPEVELMLNDGAADPVSGEFVEKYTPVKTFYCADWREDMERG